MKQESNEDNDVGGGEAMVVVREQDSAGGCSGDKRGPGRAGKGYLRCCCSGTASVMVERWKASVS